MKAIYWRLFIIRLALRWIGQLNIGDEVIYNGRRWMLIQGVSDPVWGLVSGAERVDVNKSEFRKVLGIRSAWRSFLSGYRFYMRSWYGIWKREGIRPWMRGCRIWADDSVERS